MTAEAAAEADVDDSIKRKRIRVSLNKLITKSRNDYFHNRLGELVESEGAGDVLIESSYSIPIHSSVLVHYVCTNFRTECVIVIGKLMIKQGVVMENSSAERTKSLCICYMVFCRSSQALIISHTCFLFNHLFIGTHNILVV